MVRSFAVQLLCAHASLISVLGASARTLEYPAFNRRASTTCQTSDNRETTAPRQNIWAGFNAEEREKLQSYISDWLSGTASDTTGNFTVPKNVSRAINSSSRRFANDSAPTSGNSSLPLHTLIGSLDRFDMLPPKKAEALAYVSGSGPIPPQYAQFIARYSPEEEEGGSTYLQKYSIGPLPLSPKTKIAPLSDSTQPGRSRVAFKQGRPHASADKLIKEIANSMNDILIDLTGEVCTLDMLLQI
jgi:hypothetical protein